MNKREANRLLYSADDEALQTARELMNQFITTLTGGKWANMEPGERICYLIALALKIGERRGQRIIECKAAAGATDQKDS